VWRRREESSFSMLNDFDLLTLDQVTKLLHCSKAHVGKVVGGRFRGCTLARASRIATVAELSESLAHELNQPLMSILGNTQAAKRWLNAGPLNMTEVDSSIERIVQDARAAVETMQHIRAPFKQESSEKKDVSIPYVLREGVRFVKEDPRQREVSIECHFDALPAVFVDQIQIEQVFINFIVNAIEAMESANVCLDCQTPGVYQGFE
jgi:C4-dicarboxylate-specific signal transduction histidine kinase